MEQVTNHTVSGIVNIFIRIKN